mmetsp:Transcript_82642/g.229301  ORF Transcript_82642/g.229301 Transcript_82642/m.229301 type:complete len:267 (-) Transcript_82642:629-1429(-)
MAFVHVEPLLNGLLEVVDGTGVGGEGLRRLVTCHTISGPSDVVKVVVHLLSVLIFDRALYVLQTTQVCHLEDLCTLIISQNDVYCLLRVVRNQTKAPVCNQRERNPVPDLNQLVEELAYGVLGGAYLLALVIVLRVGFHLQGIHRIHGCEVRHAPHACFCQSRIQLLEDPLSHILGSLACRVLLDPLWVVPLRSELLPLCEDDDGRERELHTVHQVLDELKALISEWIGLCHVNKEAKHKALVFEQCCQVIHDIHTVKARRIHQNQ